MDKPERTPDDVQLMADVQAVLRELTSCSYQAKRLGRPALMYALNRAWHEVQSVWEKG